MSDDKLNLILKEIQGLKSDITDIKQEITSLNKKSDTIIEQVVKNAEDIIDIKDNQRTIGNVINQIATIQQRQEDTINLLARRSIDHEAELKRIK